MANNDIAFELAKKQRDISIAEFFEKNRHLLGFDNKRKALLTVVKEAVDNSLDACEEARILPEINIEVTDMGNERFKVMVEDNGPGIVKEQIPKIFAKLLYGSKFHKLSQSLTGDTPVLIRRKGKIELIPIADLVDPFIRDEECAVDVGSQKIEAPAFDLEKYQYRFRPIGHVIKHRRQHDIYEIKTETGRSIKVTGCHSLFSVNPQSKIREVEAKDLKPGDFVVVPKNIRIEEETKTINLLDYIKQKESSGVYVYGIGEFIRKIYSGSRRVTSGKHPLIEVCLNGKKAVVYEDSFKINYLKKGFLPLSLILELGAEEEVKKGLLKTYFHGQENVLPVELGLTPSFMRLLGLFAAEGHVDKRQIGFTFGLAETELANDVVATANTLGLSSTIERRDRSIRVKLFGKVISSLCKAWCGKGAKNKHAPEFVFRTNSMLRGEFLKGLYIGDGHFFKNSNQAVLSTKSKQLANEIQYMWLMQGVVASQHTTMSKGLAKITSASYAVSVFGRDINELGVAEQKKTRNTRSRYRLFPLGKKRVKSDKEDIYRAIGLGWLNKDIKEYIQMIADLRKNKQPAGVTKHKINYLIKKDYAYASGKSIQGTARILQLEEEIQNIKRLANSDVCFLKIRNIRKITKGYDYVYDLSIPNCENFIGGTGGLSCHNSRGQQGIGISAAVLYAQLTTGRPAKITSKTQKQKQSQYSELHIDTQKNRPEIVKIETIDWDKKHGTKIELDIEASYLKGMQSVDEYIKQTAIINPHVTIHYDSSKAEHKTYQRVTNELPKEPREIKPHPYGVELGRLVRMLASTKLRTLQAFLTTEFSRVGPGTAKEICENAALLPKTKPSTLSREQAEKLSEGIKKTRLIAPPTDCISPIGEKLIEKGLKKEINAEFYCSTTRPASVYRGNPFVIECCTGDTELILENGQIMTIKDYVDGKYPDKVLSMDNRLKIVPTEVFARHKFRNTHKILEIVTRTGKRLKVTANNEIPVLERGEVVWTKAEELMAGNYIATPRVIKVYTKIPSILDILEPKHIKVMDDDVVKDVLLKLKTSFGSLKKVAGLLGINYEYFKSLNRKKHIGRINLRTLKIMVQLANLEFNKIKEKITKISYVDNNYPNPVPVDLPPICEELLYTLGLLNSDGYISKNCIVFVNKDEKLHHLFKKNIKMLFGLDIKRYRPTESNISNKTLYMVLKKLESILPKLPTNLIVSWLKGYVDGDGYPHISNDNKIKEIEIATADYKKAKLVQTLLLRVGIISKIITKKPSRTVGVINGRVIRTKKIKYDIVIGDLDGINKFSDAISFRQVKRANKLTSALKKESEVRIRGDIIPVGKTLKELRIENNLFQYELGFPDVTIRQIEKGKHNMTRLHLQQVLEKQTLSGVTYEKLKLLALSDILWDKIISVGECPFEEQVYDLTTKNENFLANNIVMHNCGIAYGGDLSAEDQVTILRFANRVPLLYQQGACSITESVSRTNWRPYGLSQSTNAIPFGPAVIMVHMASVWVPFTSEAKEAIAHYPEITKEIRLALQECGRKLSSYVNKKRRVSAELKKRGYIETYIPHISQALKELTEKKDFNENKIQQLLKKILERHRGEIEKIEAENIDYDEEYALGGKKEEKGKAENTRDVLEEEKGKAENTEKVLGEKKAEEKVKETKK